MTQPRPTMPNRLLADRRATSATEFALMAPIFILLLTGMMAYGVYFGAAHSVQQIAADAARTAVAGIDETERRTLARDFVLRNAAGYAFIDAGKVSVDVHDSLNDSSQFVVSVRYAAEDLPVWNLLADLPLPHSTISRTSTIRIGGL